ncbi:hypothetical protein CERSUDRAFT_124016 [Gelatoporia subvermispora B]|uniref:NACHT domain-containing protein n=1 Tax=Ceriporiopsis subvermispora (strain B) TaxID=914234 RepID=M2QY11_CERS8|nr:hypothetical protein CERSUDRAFT_124016 [Gelatoporia subvermispora B]
MGSCFSFLKREPPTLSHRSNTSASSGQEGHNLPYQAAEDAAQTASTSHGPGRAQAIVTTRIIDPTLDKNATTFVISPPIFDSHQSRDPVPSAKVDDPVRTTESVQIFGITPSGDVPSVSDHPMGSDSTQDQHRNASQNHRQHHPARQADVTTNPSSERMRMPQPPSQEDCGPVTYSGVLLGSHLPELETSIRRTSWSVLKDVIKGLKEICDGIPVPGLKTALSVTVVAMDKIDDLDDARSGFLEIASNIEGLGAIVRRYTHDSEIPSFILDRLNGIAAELERISTLIENKMERRYAKRLIEASDDGDKIEDIFRHLGTVIEVLQVDCGLYIVEEVEHNATEFKLEKLKSLPDASIDAQDSTRACMEGTREQLLHDLDDWAHKPSSSRVFWLNGMAGSGKSAIARSFCYRLQKIDRLAGSFFCSRGTVRDDVKRIVPTLAVSLARRSPAYRSALVSVLKDHPDAGHDDLDLQVERLIEQPLLKAFPHNRDPTMVLVVDALDECSDGKATERVLAKLISVSPHIPVKFFITSRPEPHIRAKFQSANPDLHRILRLHDIEHDLVEADISHYIGNRLEQIKQSVPDEYPAEWPNCVDVAALTRRAGLLFIYAFTALEYIKRDPVKRFKTITSPIAVVAQPLTVKLDEMYTFIVGKAMDTNEYEEDDILATRIILAAILTVREPQRLCDLSGLISIPTIRIKKILDELHAVIHIPLRDDNGVVSTFHTSFGDFMTTKARSGNYFIDPQSGHHDLTASCFEVMNRELRFNISQMSTSYWSTPYHAATTLAAHLLYACRYWPHHLCSASQPQRVADDKTEALVKCIEGWIYRKFLFWVEIFGLIRDAQLASSLIMKALTAGIMKTNKQTYALLRDANEFIVSCHEAIEASVPHIYLSGLPCISSDSKIAKIYWPKFHNTAVFHARGIGLERNTLLHIRGHTEPVRSVAVSPNGARIASGSCDHTIRVWDGRTGEEVTKPLRGPTNCVNSVVFSPDGTLIASGSDDMTVRIWDARTGKEVIEPLTGHDGGVQSVVFSPDGTRIVSGSSDHTVRVWDTRTGKEVMEPLAGHTDAINSVAISSEGTRIASGSDDNTVRVWDMATGMEVTKPLAGHTEALSSVGFSPDGTRIISGSYDCTIRLWDAKTGEQAIEPLTGHTDSVRSVAFAPDGIHVLSGSDDQSVRMWDMRTGKEIMKPTGHANWVCSVSFSPDGTQIISGSDDGTIRVWDARMDEEAIKPLPGHTGSVMSVAFSPDGSRMASGSSDRTIRVWDSRTGIQVIKALRGHEGSVCSVAFSPDGTQIASGSADRTVRLWDVGTGEVSKLLMGHTDEVKSVTFSPDGSQIFSGSDDCTIRLWDARTGEAIGEPLTGHEQCVCSVAFSPDGSRITSGSSDNTVRVWDTRTATEIFKPLEGHTSTVFAVAFSPDGTTVISGSDDKTARIWDASTGEEMIEPLKGDSDAILSVAVSPDGTWVASGSRDGAIRIWDARTGKEVIPPLTGHGGPVNSVAFSLDGTQIASGSDDGTVRIFDATIANRDGRCSHTEVNPNKQVLDSPPSLETGAYTHCRAGEYDPSSLVQSLWPTHLTNLRPLHEGTSIQDCRDAFSFRSRDSWVKGPHGELVLWIPPEYRKYLYGPRNTLVIGTGAVPLDMRRYVHGPDWTKCYTPSTSSIKS